MRSPRVRRSYSSQGFIPIPLVPGEVNWFYASLGIDDTYFANESVPVIADHIIALFGAKVLAYTKHDPRALVIDLERVAAGDEAEIDRLWKAATELGFW